MASLFLVAAFFCSFVWDQHFNLLAGLACLVGLTGALVFVLGGSATFFKAVIDHSATRPILMMAGALFIWIWVRAFTSDVPATSILSASYYVIPFLVAAVVVRLPGVFLSRAVVPGMIAILVFIAVNGIRHVFVDGFVGRIDWPMQDANHLAMIMNTFFLVSLGMMVLPRTRLIGVVLGVIALVTILLAASRAGMIALSIGTIVFAILTLPRVRISRRMVAGSVVAFIGVIIAITLLRPHETSAFFNLIRGFSNLESLHGSRPEIWLATIGLIAHRPIFGYGTGTFLHVYPQGMTPTQINAGYAAHNDLLHLTLETGIIGGLLYAGLGLSVLWAALRTRHLVQNSETSVCRNVALAAMTTLALHAQIEFMMMVVPVLMLFGTALGVFVRTILTPGVEDYDTTVSSKSSKITEMMAVVILGLLLTLSITQTYAQICAERAQDNFFRHDTDAFLENVQRSILYGLDEQATPYYLQASFLLSARMSGQMMDPNSDDQINGLLQNALARNPYMSSVYGAYGKLDLLQGKSPEAHLQKGLALEPRNASLRLELLKYYERSGRVADVQALVSQTRLWTALRGDVAGLKAFMERYPEPASKSGD